MQIGKLQTEKSVRTNTNRQIQIENTKTENRSGTLHRQKYVRRVHIEKVWKIPTGKHKSEKTTFQNIQIGKYKSGKYTSGENKPNKYNSDKDTLENTKWKNSNRKYTSKNTTRENTTREIHIVNTNRKKQSKK